VSDHEFTMSPSQLRVWLECEQKWTFAYVEGLAPKWGNTYHLDKGTYLHQLLHYYYNLLHQYRIGDQIVFDAVMNRITEDLKLMEVPDYDFYNQVVSTMARYMKQRSPEIDMGLQNHEVELHLEHEYDGTLFHGFIDLAYDGKIRDHKTGAGRFTYDPNTDVQLLFYAMLWWLTYGEVPYVEISFVNSSAKTNNPWSLQGFQPTEKQVASLWDFVRSEDEIRKSLKPRSNWTACKGCPYFPLCRAKRRGYSDTVIRKSNYAFVRGPNAGSNSPGDESFALNLGGRAY
jgi:hypothetical protein